MPRTIGLFQWRMDWADLWFNQCEAPGGLDGDIRLRPNDPGADHLLLIGPPVSSTGAPRLGGWRRHLAKARGRYDAERGALAIRRLGRPPEDVSMLVYEPACAFSDAWFEMARDHCARVYAPDPRATHPIRLPATWSFEDRLGALRDEPPPPAKPLLLAAVTSGKVLWEGHPVRLDFLRRLRAAGVPFELYGRNLPPDLAPRGPLLSKANVLRAARFTLAIENDAQGDLYASEKLWDPLICWSLPIYHGSRAADAIIPTDAFIRIPDLGDDGVESVRNAIARRDRWQQSLDAIAEARALALGSLRLVEWIRRTLVPPPAHGTPTL